MLPQQPELLQLQVIQLQRPVLLQWQPPHPQVQLLPLLQVPPQLVFQQLQFMQLIPLLELLIIHQQPMQQPHLQVILHLCFLIYKFDLMKAKPNSMTKIDD